jgi:subtilisin family serine protease
MNTFVRSKVLASAVAVALSAGTVAGHAFAADPAQDPNAAAISGRLWMIEFAEPGLLYFQGDAQQPQGTAPAGQRRLDVHTPAAVQYQSRLTAAQDAHIAAIEARLGRSVQAIHRYAITHSGIALELTEEEAARIRDLPGIVSVEKEALYQLDTHRGPTFIGAPTIWDGSNAPGGFGSLGQGVTIGVFDTGANLNHPSFAPMGAACGFSTPQPKLVALDCSAANCAGPSPGDADDHGSHTASTAGGNFVPRGENSDPLRNISGVAPCANLRTYRVCFPSGCTGTAITNAINQAIADGIDVANFSLGPNINGQLNPWTDSTDRRVLDMVNSGIFVSMSAGNTRASPVINPPAEVKHVGPWNITVANSGHDGVPRADGFIQVTGPTPVPSNLASLTLSASDVPPPPAATGVVVRHVASNAFGCTSFAPGTFSGAYALVSRGGTPEACAFAVKVANAVAAGAQGVIIYNNVAGAFSPGTNAQEGTPVGTLTQTDGQALASFITANGATPTLVTVNPPPLTTANVLDSGSLRGPNLCCNGSGAMNVTKPDITAPGINIYAAASGTGAAAYANISGTSMSSPHVAGAGALVRAVRPTWTPVEVNSALMMTATLAGQLMPDGTTAATPDEVGSGMVNLRGAALAGLVLNETFANFVAANPNSGGQPHTLNIASLRNVGCTGNCQWTRTFRNTLSTPTNWTVAAVNVPAGLNVTVSPTSFSFTGEGVLDPDVIFIGTFEDATPTAPETQAVTVTATPTTTLANVVFAQIVLTETGGQSPPLRLTVAVRGAP